MGEFNTDDQCIYNCGQESLRRQGVALIVNRRLGCNIQNKRMSSVHFQGDHLVSQQPKSMSQQVMLKNMKLNGSMKTYKAL